jgi:N-acyl-D-aspartate/D-glutamate deacylase
MLDTIIRGGTVIDGRGSPGRRADVGVRNGRVTEIGAIKDAAGKTINADGQIVCPGFVDPHTHYDAQLFWDPLANPSNVHGVTSVIGGNCGFTLAPLNDSDADYLRRMMAQVEGMPLEALETGLPWNWNSFGDYLDRLEGRIGVNAAFMVGHSAIRRTVMGAQAVGEKATPAQVAAMVKLMHESLAAGGLGFSSSLSFTHMDGDGKPVPSRWSDRAAEVMPLVRALKDHPGTSLELITDGCITQFSDEEVDLMTRMSLESARPLNWNVLQINAKDRARYDHQMSASRRGAAKGARIVALTMPTNVAQTMSFLSYCALQLIPGWKDILRLPVPERIAKLKDPAVRRWMVEQTERLESGGLKELTRWETYTIGDTFSEANKGLSGRRLGDIAKQQGKSPTDAMFDLVINDELQTILWPGNHDDSEASWKLRAEAWTDPYVLLGGSDAGAHLDRMCGSCYPTQFLGDCIRGRRLLPVERAVQLLTQTPAKLFGLRDRGELRAGAFADIAIFDPSTIDAGPVHRVADLPGGSWRLTADAIGVTRVMVNGADIVVDNRPTGNLPGRLMRSGRDTDTAPLAF